MAAPLDDGTRIARRVYQILSSRSGVRPEEISRALNLTFEQVEDALTWLVEHGLVDRRSAMSVTTPHAALQCLLAGQQARLEEFMHAGQMVADIATDFLAMPSSDARRFSLEVLEDKDCLHQRLAELQLFNNQEALVMLPNLVSRERLQVSVREDLKLLDRGIRYRLLLQASALSSEAAIEYVNTLREYGAEIRIAESLPLRLLLLDQEKIIARSHFDGKCGDFMIHGGMLTEVFAGIFDHSWSAAIPYSSEENFRSSIPLLTPAHRCILRMIAAGATDKSIARYLGCSDRTVRRLVAEILRILGTDNRFTAIVMATQYGLVGHELTTPQGSARAPGAHFPVG